MGIKSVTEWIGSNLWQVALMLIGSGLLVAGMVITQKESHGDDVVVILPTVAPSVIPVKNVVVDVAGAVENPGVYQLTHGARISEALIAAGGMAGNADRDWVARQLNQAALVQDGMKLYIPAEGEGYQAAQDNPGNQEDVSINTGGIISLNYATEKELDALWGIGEARAKTIIDNRPYNDIKELVTKAKLPQDILDKNSGKIGL